MKRIQVFATMKRDGRYWVVDIPDLHGATQGLTRHDALLMAADWVLCVRPDDMLPPMVYAAVVTGPLKQSKDTIVITTHPPEALQEIKRHRAKFMREFRRVTRAKR